MDKYDFYDGEWLESEHEDKKIDKPLEETAQQKQKNNKEPETKHFWIRTL